LGHAIEPTEARNAVEDPGKLGVLGDLALVEQNAAFRVEARGDIGSRHLADGRSQLIGILPYGDRVHIDHAVDALVRLLQLDPLEHGAEIIAQVQAARRLHARKDSLLKCHGSPSSAGARYRV